MIETPYYHERVGEPGASYGELPKNEKKLSADMPTAKRPMARNLLAGVIAVVGCDGSGKSTLTADLLEHLSQEYPTELVYLGQDSGNILKWILDIPLIGKAAGRYLLRKSDRAHPDADKPASLDTTTALVVHLLSRWRRHKFRRMRTLDRRGIAVITDRYPQAEVPDFHFDGPGLIAAGTSNGLIRWLAARELYLYQDMAGHVPALVIRLNIDAETAHARKPDHKLSMLREKTKIIPRLSFNNARIVDFDAREPYSQVLKMALAAARTALAVKADPMRWH